MFEKWKERFFVKKEEKEPVVIAIHGFGKRRTDEYNALKKAMGKRELVLPELFNPSFENDVHWYNWVSKAEEKVIAAKNEGREVILIGFSMGGVIATYIASKFKVKRLILIAPAFEYMTMTTVQNTIQHSMRKKEVVKDQYVELPNGFVSVFMDVVNNCKDAIGKVSCPVLMIHAMNDEVIPYTVSLKYYKKIPHEEKRCLILADGQHRLLDDERLSKTVVSIILEELRLS